MALFHLSVTQTKRSAGQSAIASAAYRAGERLYSEYYGEYSDYTRKGGVICSDILLPSHAPPEYADRQTLWHQLPETRPRCAIITRDEFSCPKFTRAGTRPTGFEQRIHTGGFRMNKLLSCRYNMDTNRVEARFADGTILSIDCIAVEDEYSNTPAQRAELDWLLYNNPLEYAQLVLSGEIEHYLSLGCDYGRLED